MRQTLVSIAGHNRCQIMHCAEIEELRKTRLHPGVYIYIYIERSGENA